MKPGLQVDSFSSPEAEQQFGAYSMLGVLETAFVCRNPICTILAVRIEDSVLRKVAQYQLVMLQLTQGA